MKQKKRPKFANFLVLLFFPHFYIHKKKKEKQKIDAFQKIKQFFTEKKQKKK